MEFGILESFRGAKSFEIVKNSKLPKVLSKIRQRSARFPRISRTFFRFSGNASHVFEDFQRFKPRERAASKASNRVRNTNSKDHIRPLLKSSRVTGTLLVNYQPQPRFSSISPFSYGWFRRGTTRPRSQDQRRETKRTYTYVRTLFSIRPTNSGEQRSEGGERRTRYSQRSADDSVIYDIP